MSKYVTTHQYEPLRTPQGWSGDERRFIAQLTDIFDDIYRRFGRLRMEDLSGKTQAVINAKAESEDVEKLEAELTLTAEGLSSKVSRGEVISAINQSAEEVGIEASKINLNGAVTANRYFKINLDGSMEAVSGKVGGFVIGENTLTGGGAFPIALDAEDGVISAGNLFMRTQDNGIAEVGNAMAGGMLMLSADDVAIGDGILVDILAVRDGKAYVRGVEIPKIMRGSCYVSGDSATMLDYSEGNFTSVPVVVATYSQTGGNESGDDGVIKIYNKTDTWAHAILSGSGTRQIDWIAVGV